MLHKHMYTVMINAKQISALFVLAKKKLPSYATF